MSKISRKELRARLEQVEGELRALRRPPMRFSNFAGASEAKRDIDAWKAAHPELERRHCELRTEAEELERRLEELERREHLEATLAAKLSDAGAKPKSLACALEAESKPALEAVRAWLDKRSMWALVLCGTTGTGKTVAGVWAMAHALRRGGTAAARTAGEIGRMPLFRSARERDEFRHLCGVNMLLIDELGLSPLTENGRGLLIELLNERYEASARTIIASNAIGVPALLELLGERVLDRLRDGGRVVDVSGQSMRAQNRLPPRGGKRSEDE